MKQEEDDVKTKSLHLSQCLERWRSALQVHADELQSNPEMERATQFFRQGWRMSPFDDSASRWQKGRVVDESSPHRWEQLAEYGADFEATGLDPFDFDKPNSAERALVVLTTLEEVSEELLKELDEFSVGLKEQLASLLK